MERGHICARAFSEFLVPRGDAADQGSKKGEEYAQDGKTQNSYARILDAENSKLSIAFCEGIQVEWVRWCRGCIRRRGAVKNVVYCTDRIGERRDKKKKEGVTSGDEDEREAKLLCERSEVRWYDDVQLSQKGRV